MSTDKASSFERWSPDGTCYARVAIGGATLGIQLEPSIQHLSGSQIAERIMACNDVAYLEGRLALRATFEQDSDRFSLDGLETREDLNAALRRLAQFNPPEQR